MSKTSESMSGDNCAAVSARSRSDVSCLLGGFQGRRRRSAGGLWEKGPPRTREEGRRVETFEIVQDFAQDVAAEVDLMVDLPVGVLGIRGPPSPLSGAFISRSQRELIWWIFKAGPGERGVQQYWGRSSKSLQRVSVLPG